jgi:hypothetical protein
MAMNRTYWLDLGERVGATAGEAVLGVLITEMSSLPMWWAALLIPVLSAAKGFLARYIGAPSSASLLRRRPAVTPAPAVVVPPAQDV